MQNLGLRTQNARRRRLWVGAAAFLFPKNSLRDFFGNPITPSAPSGHLPLRGRQGESDILLGSLFEGAVEQSETEGVVSKNEMSRARFPCAS